MQGNAKRDGNDSHHLQRRMTGPTRSEGRAREGPKTQGWQGPSLRRLAWRGSRRRRRPARREGSRCGRRLRAPCEAPAATGQRPAFTCEGCACEDGEACWPVQHREPRPQAPAPVRPGATPLNLRSALGHARECHLAHLAARRGPERRQAPRSVRQVRLDHNGFGVMGAGSA